MADFWSEYGGHIETLAYWAVGILVYGLIVNAFYQVISKRAMFAKKKLHNRLGETGFWRGLAYVALFPAISFSFFLVLAGALIFLSGAERAADPLETFTLAMAIVGAVRIAAYFSEATSHDIAKMLPLGLLGVFLVTGEFTDLETSFRQLSAIRDHIDVVGVFFGIIVVLEYWLRLMLIMIVSVRDRSKKPPKVKGVPTTGTKFQRT